MKTRISKRRVSGLRVCVEPFRLKDAGLVADWKKDARLRGQILASPDPAARRPEAIRRGLRRALANPNEVVFAIRPLDERRPIGMARLMWIDWANGTADLGLYIGETARRGRGLGTEALTLFIGEAFGRWGLRKISLKVGASNRKAAKLYRKLGFRPEGVLRRQIRNGKKFEDVIWMRIFREEWISREKK